MNNVTANFSKTQHYNPQRIYHSQRKTFAERRRNDKHYRQCRYSPRWPDPPVAVPYSLKVGQLMLTLLLAVDLFDLINPG